MAAGVVYMAQSAQKKPGMSNMVGFYKRLLSAFLTTGMCTECKL